MTKKHIERHLVKGVKELGGLCYKFVSPGTHGVPDRLIITAHGRIVFAELKTDKGMLSKIQEYVIGQMRLRHADVRVLYGLKQVKELLAGIGCEVRCFSTRTRIRRIASTTSSRVTAGR